MNPPYPVATMLPNQWKLPLNLAIGLHLLVIAAVIVFPAIFKSKPKFADIYTVSLINVAVPAPPAPAPAKPAKPKVSKPATTAPTPPKPTKKAVPIAKPEPKETPPPVAEKTVSLKPVKKKVEKVKPPEPKPRNQEADRQKRQRLAQALREEELMAEKARLAQEALEAERELAEQQAMADFDSIPPRTPVESGSRTAAPAAAAGTSSLLESQYYAAITARLQQFWAPPEYLQQDPDLSATIIITINQDGTVADMQFENRSGDRVFDRFVDKTITDAAPLPPIPPALKKQRFEFGLRFKPGSIQGSTQ